MQKIRYRKSCLKDKNVSQGNPQIEKIVSTRKYSNIWKIQKIWTYKKIVVNPNFNPKNMQKLTQGGQKCRKWPKMRFVFSQRLSLNKVKFCQGLIIISKMRQIIKRWPKNAESGLK